MPKQLPEDECVAVSAEIRELLELRDSKGRRLWTQASLGAACGVSQEAIRKACIPAGVWPTVRDGILKVTEQSAAALIGKHERLQGELPARAPAVSAARLFTTVDNGKVSSPAVGDARLIALNVIAALEKDGFQREDAKRAVSDLLFDGGNWESEADLYRQARADLATKRSGRKLRGLAPDASPTSRRKT